MSRPPRFMTTAKITGKPIFEPKSVSQVPPKVEVEVKSSQPEPEIDLQDRLDEAKTKLANFKITDPEDTPRMRTRKAKVVASQSDEDEPTGVASAMKDSKSKSKRQPSLWMMFQKEMRATDEVQALPGKDRLSYITLKWNEYKEQTPKYEQEDHAIRYTAKQLVRQKLRKKKEAEELIRYQEYLENVAGQMEADDDYDNIFKIKKLPAKESPDADFVAS